MASTSNLLNAKGGSGSNSGKLSLQGTKMVNKKFETMSKGKEDLIGNEIEVDEEIRAELLTLRQEIARINHTISPLQSLTDLAFQF